MARPKLEGVVVTYEEIASLCKCSINQVQQAATRYKHDLSVQPCDISSLRSVCLYIAAKAEPELREKIAALSVPVIFDRGVSGPGKLPRTY
jgi:hypothetical protein